MGGEGGIPPLGIERVDRFDRGAIALLFLRLDLGEAGAAAPAFGDELGRRRVVRRHRLRNRVTGSDGDEARAEDRVRTSGEDLGLLDRIDRLSEPETELQAAALAD